MSRDPHAPHLKSVFFFFKVKKSYKVVREMGKQTLLWFYLGSRQFPVPHGDVCMFR